MVVNQYKNITTTSASELVKLLLITDLAFIALHCVNLVTRTSPMWNIVLDQSYSEVFQYIKFLWVALMLVAVGSATQTRGFFAWAALFAYLLTDDAMSVHESVGKWLVIQLDLQPMGGLRANDFGELITSAVFAGSILMLIAGFYFTGDKMFKKFSRDMALLIGLLAFFGVGVDMAHMILGHNKWMNHALGIVEDGGEMIAVSLMVWYVFAWQQKGGRASAFLQDLLPKQIRLA